LGDLRCDRHRRHLLLSELIDESGLVVQTAFQIALLEAGALFDETTRGVSPFIFSAASEL
jgi:predicted transcriptional regulator